MYWVILVFFWPLALYIRLLISVFFWPLSVYIRLLISVFFWPLPLFLTSPSMYWAILVFYYLSLLISSVFIIFCSQVSLSSSMSFSDILSLSMASSPPSIITESFLGTRRMSLGSGIPASPGKTFGLISLARPGVYTHVQRGHGYPGNVTIATQHHSNPAPLQPSTIATAQSSDWKSDHNQPIEGMP